MIVNLIDLPYKKDALSPYISQKTIEYHYGKHHKTYVDNANKLLADAGISNEPLESIIQKYYQNEKNAGIFNNCAQAWNHAFYWQCMKPDGGGKPVGSIAAKIDAKWGDYNKFVEEFKNAGLTQFGSGWAWLVMEKNVLKIVKTGNADTPIAHRMKPLLVVDVWEHAYYLDYQNRRADYLAAFIEKLINWDFVNSCLD